MTNDRRRFSWATRRRIPTVAALALAVIGALLITLAACSSRSGPPQPTAAAAGNISGGPAAVSPSSSAAAPSAAASSAGSSTHTVPTATSKAGPATGSITTGSATTGSKSATGAPGSAKAPTPIVPTGKVTLPTFANAAKGPVLLPSAPVSLSIPAIGVTSTLLTLGLNPDGSVEVPPLDEPQSKAGWYKNSPTPGSVGPAILLGHIDTKKYGPGVFYNLGNLKPGDQIDVTRQDGSVAVFAVDGVRSYPKNAFPTATVYGNLDHAGLRLITCGGTFDPSISSYESNIIAFASLVSSH